MNVRDKLILIKWWQLWFEITINEEIISLEDFSEHLCDWVNDYLEEQHQVILDEIPNSFLP